MSNMRRKRKRSYLGHVDRHAESIAINEDVLRELGRDQVLIVSMSVRH